jgi:hypothetical protein
MSVPSIIFAAFFVVIADGAVHLFKKFEHGDWATKFRNLSLDARSAVSVCFLCCFPLAAFLTVVTFRLFGLRSALILAIFFLFAHFIYRTLMLVSDKAAGKCASRNEHWIQKEDRVRRYFSFFFAIFALLSSAAIILCLQRTSFFP